jgi:hypothetical protein
MSLLGMIAAAQQDQPKGVRPLPPGGPTLRMAVGHQHLDAALDRRSADELVSETEHREDAPRIARVFFNFLSEPSNMNVYCAGH